MWRIHGQKLEAYVFFGPPAVYSALRDVTHRDRCADGGLVTSVERVLVCV